jgi:hypothetical protein
MASPNTNNRSLEHFGNQKAIDRVIRLLERPFLMARNSAAVLISPAAQDPNMLIHPQNPLKNQRFLVSFRGTTKINNHFDIVDAVEKEDGKGMTATQACTEYADSRHDLGIAHAEIVAIAGDEPNAILVPPGEDAKAIVFDLVNPIGTRRRLLRRPGQAWFKGGLTTEHRPRGNSKAAAETQPFAAA